MSASFYRFVIEVYKYSLCTEFMHFKERLQIRDSLMARASGKRIKNLHTQGHLLENTYCQNQEHLMTRGQIEKEIK